MSKHFEKKRAGIDPLTASEWNELVKMVQRLNNFSVGRGLNMINTPSGRALTLAPMSSNWFIAKVVDEGPNSEPNYTDQRYWVKEQKLSNTSGADTTDITWADETRDDALYVTATNMAEVISESHDFPDDDDYRVLVFAVQDQQPLTRYVFTSLPIIVE